MIKQTTVTLRIKEKPEQGKGLLFLEYYPPLFDPGTRKTRRYEYLHYFVFLNPSGEEQKTYNREIMKIGETLRCKRIIEIAHNRMDIFDEERLKQDFLAYFKKFSDDDRQKWYASYLHFREFMNGRCTFGNITPALCERFKEYLLTEAKKKDGSNLNNNTAAAYYCLFMSAIKEAYKARFIKENICDFLTKIPEKKTHKEYLTMEEVRRLAATPCEHDVLKRASLFSIMTGLRISDIISLQWENIRVAPDGGPCIIKNIDKVKRDEIIYISEEAISYCGKQYLSGPVFPGLTRDMIYKPLFRWIERAGIDKHITFHCFRHTFATLQLANGTDIYTVSHQLSHKNISTTQIYVDLVDEKRRASANAISISHDNK